jgi:protein transport protein SEC31
VLILLYTAALQVLDAAIKRAVICGEFEGAVDCCFRFGRLADALLLAATGGRELFQRTQERYLALNAAQAYVKVTRSIVNHQLQSLVDESEPRCWKETLAILVTYATADEFASLCDSLATRLKEVGNDICISTCMHVCMYIRLYVYILCVCVCVCVRVCVNICIYIIY